MEVKIEYCYRGRISGKYEIIRHTYYTRIDEQFDLLEAIRVGLAGVNAITADPQLQAEGEWVFEKAETLKNASIFLPNQG